jgi:16S rRNA (guanine(1405)-N(7))-methyltransferase
MSDLEAIVSAVTSSKKYRAVCADTVRAIAEREMQHHGDLKSAIKATKRRLHQVYGAFGGASDYEAAYEALAAAYAGGAEAEIRAACRQVLERHSSTRERLPILDRFYPAIWQVTGQPASVLDLGCGLHPLALPWMDLAPETRYIALDVDAERTEFLNRYLALAGLEPLARCQDVVVEPPRDRADVALLLKMSPTLERLATGATLDLIGQLNCPWVVVSFAIKSLGGREKGMLAHYHSQFMAWVEGHDWAVERLDFESELVFVVKRKA